MLFFYDKYSSSDSSHLHSQETIPNGVENTEISGLPQFNSSWKVEKETHLHVVRKGEEKSRNSPHCISVRSVAWTCARPLGACMHVYSIPCVCTHPLHVCTFVYQGWQHNKGSPPVHHQCIKSSQEISVQTVIRATTTTTTTTTITTTALFAPHIRK